jgi:hypothetical protein
MKYLNPRFFVKASHFNVYLKLIKRNCVFAKKIKADSSTLQLTSDGAGLQSSYEELFKVFIVLLIIPIKNLSGMNRRRLQELKMIGLKKAPLRRCPSFLPRLIDLRIN